MVDLIETYRNGSSNWKATIDCQNLMIAGFLNKASLH